MRHNVRQLSRAQSAVAIHKLYESAKVMSDFYVRPGYTLVYRYDAKDKTEIYDRRPMVLILAISPSHVLGLNFHWLPFDMRMNLVKYIIKQSQNYLRKTGRVLFSYKKLKPILKKLGYLPCIRLYIRSRMSSQCIPIPAERLLEVAQLNMAMFTGVPEITLWNMKKRLLS